jgi:hypothetical protein
MSESIKEKAAMSTVGRFYIRILAYHSLSQKMWSVEFVADYSFYRSNRPWAKFRSKIRRWR